MGRDGRRPEPWCPVAATLDVLGGKWKPTILLQLRDRPRQFNELRRRIPGITPRVLALQLRALEQAGLVSRTEKPGRVPQVEYAFTPKGLSLGPILEAMERWGDEHARPR